MQSLLAGNDMRAADILNGINDSAKLHQMVALLKKPESDNARVPLNLLESQKKANLAV